MSINLSTQPTFLRSRFEVTRVILQGFSHIKKDQKASESDSNFSQTKKSTSSSPKTSVFAPIKRFFSSFISLFSYSLLGIFVLGLLFYVGPNLYYATASADSSPINFNAIFAVDDESENIAATDSAKIAESPTSNNSEEIAVEPYQPEFNPNLPEGDWLVIPRIGVRTELQKTQQAEEALKDGVWHVPGYGTPENNKLPIILAAHRFGWEWWWQSDYWKYNSFYSLPDTEPGDRVEIISGQRKWVYEIYDAHEGDEIKDYNADLILYTCKFLNSPIRHFRYANLVEV